MGMALNLFKKQAFKKAIKLTHIELKKYFMVMYPLITMFCIRGRSQTTLTTDKTGQVGGIGNVNGHTGYIEVIMQGKCGRNTETTFDIK